MKYVARISFDSLLFADRFSSLCRGKLEFEGSEEEAMEWVKRIATNCFMYTVTACLPPCCLHVINGIREPYREFFPAQVELEGEPEGNYIILLASEE